MQWEMTRILKDLEHPISFRKQIQTHYPQAETFRLDDVVNRLAEGNDQTFDRDVGESSEDSD